MKLSIGAGARRQFNHRIAPPVHRRARIAGRSLPADLPPGRWQCVQGEQLQLQLLHRD
jgi:hypothetical protein